MFTNDYYNVHVHFHDYHEYTILYLHFISHFYDNKYKEYQTAILHTLEHWLGHISITLSYTCAHTHSSAHVITNTYTQHTSHVRTVLTMFVMIDLVTVSIRINRHLIPVVLLP